MIEGLFQVLELEVHSPEELTALDALFAESPRGREGVAQLTELWAIVREAGYAEQVKVDLSIARGLDYYTGTIYETLVLGRENFGSVMSGGRYDGLLGMFLKKSIPAVGISLGIDRLISVLVDLGLFEARSSLADVYVVLFDGADFGHNAAIARDLRAAGVNVETSLAAARMGKQLKQASKRGCRWALFAGEGERAAQQVIVKDLAEGVQHEVSRDAVVEWFTERLVDG